MKFKIGDIVRGTKNRIYSITNEDMTKGLVVYVRSYEEDDEIEIKVLEHKTKPEEIGHSFSVKSKFFEPVREHKIVIAAD